MSGRLRVTLRKSTVGTTAGARGTVRALGLRRIGQTVELPDQPSVRGQVRAVRYLVAVEEVAGTVTRGRAAGAARATASKNDHEEAES